MSKKSAIVFMVLMLVALASPAFAQTGNAAAATGGGLGNWGLSGIGLGIAVGFAGLGQGKIAASACEGIARNPGAGARVQLAMILGLAFVESLVLFIWVMLFLRAA